ncbi:MAG: MucBP domain-containing protein, partial [Clostridiales bacterium]|nr:MucBP domain-containing protein [Clostridiales bacterium]
MNPVDFTLNWTADDGSAMTSLAMPLTFPDYPNSFWLYVDDQAFNKDAVLHIADNFAQYAGGFSVGNDVPVSSLFSIDAGQSPTQDNFVLVQALDASGNVAETYRLYLSRQTAEPQPPEEEPQVIPAANVAIHYVDLGGLEVASLQTKTYEAGTHTVYPDPADLQADYVPYDTAPKTLTVDISGANPTDIYFTYQYQAPAINAVVNVNYVGPNGEPVATSQQKYFDQAGTYDISAAPDDLFAGYTLNAAETQQVTVDQNGANPSEISFSYSAPVIPDAVVNIRFVNEQGDQVASPQQVSYEAGSHEVMAQPNDLEPGYNLVDNAPQYVAVDAQGANPAELTFVYRSSLAPSVDIVVHFVDMDGTPIAPDRVQTVNDGTNAVKADEISGYIIQGEDTQYVTVTMQGAEPNTVIFSYQQIPEETPVIEEPTAPPAPKVDFVNVYYKDQNGNVLYEDKAKTVEGEETLITVDLNLINQEQYELNDAAQKTATIDSSGNLNPSEIVFLFTAKAQDISARLSVLYRNTAGQQVADAQEIILTQAGFNNISPNPQNLLPGYEAVSAEQKQVLVSEDGQVSPGQIEFIYQEAVSKETPAPIETTYEITPIDNLYVHPHKDGINIRSSPKVDPSNILGAVNASDVGRVMGMALNEQKEEWYLLQINENEAFNKKSVTVQMTEDEVNKHFGWTPGPATPAPTPTAQPEGMLIGRWGETNVGQLGFRKDPNDKVSNNIISRLDKGAKVWVYAQEIVGAANELWYEIMVSGKIGYVKADFITLYDQQKSDEYQAGLASPVPPKVTPTPNPEEVTPTPSPEMTLTPTLPPTQTPAVATASPVPQPYLGYALTTKQAALRTGANTQDESILATLPINTLVYALAQTYVPGGETWHHVDVLNGSNQSGFVPESAIRRISPTEAESYLQSAQPPTAAPTRVPDRVSGYAITLGRDVLMREYSDTNAKISRVLAEDTIVMVTAQEYVQGVSWHLVQHNGLYGFIRADQLRMLTPQETGAYLESLKQTPPPPKATLPPLSTDSLSSYGFVNADKVRLRKDTSTSSSTLKFMDRNAFALVIDTVTAKDGSQWFRINQNGTEGYVMGRYLSVLKLGELQQYLSSNDFQSGNNQQAGPTGGTTNITPLEDYNKVVWKNPNIQASYEPFNPIATPTPPVEAILSPSVPPLSGDFIVEASPSIDPLTTFEPMGTEAPSAKTSRFPTGLLAVGIIGVLGGGGYYAYRMYQDNQRKAAQRAAQRRQQAAQQSGRPTTNGQPPLARPAGGQANSHYAPPVGNQGTTAYKPTQPGQVPPPVNSQGTAAYRPTQPGQV